MSRIALQTAVYLIQQCVFYILPNRKCVEILSQYIYIYILYLISLPLIFLRYEVWIPIVKTPKKIKCWYVKGSNNQIKPWYFVRLKVARYNVKQTKRANPWLSLLSGFAHWGFVLHSIRFICIVEMILADVIGDNAFKISFSATLNNLYV